MVLKEKAPIEGNCRAISHRWVIEGWLLGNQIYSVPNMLHGFKAVSFNENQILDGISTLKVQYCSITNWNREVEKVLQLCFPPTPSFASPLSKNLWDSFNNSCIVGNDSGFCCRNLTFHYDLCFNLLCDRKFSYIWEYGCEKF